jgi:hypothetical protein
LVVRWQLLGEDVTEVIDVFLLEVFDMFNLSLAVELPKHPNKVLPCVV